MNAADSIVIAVDGPSAVGKGTASRELARRLGFLHVDTGAMYRALTWHCQQQGLVPADEEGRELTHDQAAAVAQECTHWPVKLTPKLGHLEVLVGERCLHDELRSGRVTKYVARVSHVPGVRGWMLGFQRDCLRFGSLVMDGRDIGTRIFRETPFKFYLTADPAVRRARGQNAGHGGGSDFRDAIDADLNYPAADATVVDTSTITAAQAVERILEELRRLAPARFPARNGV